MQKIFFQRESSNILFVSEELFEFLYGALGAVSANLACACMLFSVKFYVVKREVWMLWRRLSEKEV